MATLLTLVGAAPAAAASLPQGFEERTLASNLQAPTAVAWAPDGRMFVAEKGGRLKVVAPGSTSATPILDISATVNDTSDRGLLGLAVDSSYASNHYLYLLYTYDFGPVEDSVDTRTVSQLLRVVVNPDNTIGERKVILGTYTSGACPPARNDLDCIPSDGPSHSVGTVRSAPDGTLWVGSGDAADFGGVDPLAFRTYDEQSFAGKIVHVTREGRGLASHPFCPSNADLTHVCTKLWAKGFRNPSRFTLRPGGGLVVGEVGWNEREEVDVIGAGGRSYGWPCYEGGLRTAGYRDRPECPAEYAKEGTAGAHVGPSFEYAHAVGRSVIGGPSYAGDQYPAGYREAVFYGDYTGETINRLTLDGQGQVTQSTAFATGWTGGVFLDSSPTGNLVYVDIGTFQFDGTVREVLYSPGNRTPVASATAAPASGAVPLIVDYDGSGSSDPDGDPLSYDWDFGDGSAHSSAAAPRHAYPRNGRFTAELTVSDGRGRAHTKTVSILAGSAPTATISTPAPGSLFRAGEAVTLSGSGSDPDDGPLPESALSWWVTLHHDTHTHFLSSFTGVAQASFAPLRTHDADSFYEVTLTVRDSDGLPGSRTVRIDPQTVQGTVESAPTGASVSYAGQGGAAPLTKATTVGFDTTASAEESFIVDGRTFHFDRWADGVEERARAVRVPAADFSLRALYLEDKAEGGLATASSSEGAAFGPQMAVDGDSATRWSSSFADGQHWQVDLGRSRTVDRVRLNWTAALAARYRILTSRNGVDFSPAADQSVSAGGWQTTPFGARNARYVRVEVIQPATGWGVSFWDAQVLGPDDVADEPEPDGGPSTGYPPPGRALLRPRSYPETVLATERLFRYYRLGERGRIARELRGGPPARYRGSPRRVPSLIEGGDMARRFDGLNDLVQLGSPAFGAPGRFSVEAWVRLGRTARRSQFLFTASRAGRAGVTLWIDGRRRVRFRVVHGPKGAVATAPRLPRGRIAHVVGSYDGRRVRVYVDGRLGRSMSLRTRPGRMAKQRLVLGGMTRRSRRPNGMLDGALDEVALYARALPAAEVHAHSKAGR